MAATLDDVMAALAAADSRAEPVSVVVRLPEPLHRAVVLATELGMDESFTAATAMALRERAAQFARGRALAEHFRKFPSDIPDLAEVAIHRAQGTGHPVTSHPHLAEEAAELIESRHPSWATDGDVDDTVDAVLALADVLAARDRNGAS